MKGSAKFQPLPPDCAFTVENFGENPDSFRLRGPKITCIPCKKTFTIARLQNHLDQNHLHGDELSPLPDVLVQKVIDKGKDPKDIMLQGEKFVFCTKCDKTLRSTKISVIVNHLGTNLHDPKQKKEQEEEEEVVIVEDITSSSNSKKRSFVVDDDYIEEEATKMADSEALKEEYEEMQKKIKRRAFAIHEGRIKQKNV